MTEHNNPAPDQNPTLASDEPAGTKPRRRWVTPTVAAGTLLLGVGIGTSAADAEPEIITEIETVTETEEVEVEVEVPVEVVPEACINLGETADGIFDLYSEGILAAADAMDAAIRLDAYAIDEQTAKFEELNPQLEADLVTFYLQKAICEEAAE